MRRNSLLAIGVGSGAALMYYLDPDRGRRRRALVRDTFSHLGTCSSSFLNKAFRDTGNRLHGAYVAGTHLVSREPVPTDDVIAARVRSKLGRLASHPASIEVQVRDGRAVLSGPILHRELKRVLSGVESVPGVRGVENRLEVHRTGEGISGLQGPGSARRGELPELLQDNWTPALRLAAMAGGGALAGYGARQGGVLGTLMGIAGGLALTRAVSNRGLTRVVGLGNHKPITVQKTININAPLEKVFELWTHFDQFPRFMAHVRDVRPIGNNRWRWSVAGPGGAPIKWDAEVTRLEPNRVVAWKSVPGALVENSGIVVFCRNPQGGTQIDIRISYHPPLGDVGHAALSVAGLDPRSMMHLDLVQLKSILEEGMTRKNGEKVTPNGMSGGHFGTAAAHMQSATGL